MKKLNYILGMTAILAGLMFSGCGRIWDKIDGVTGYSQEEIKSYNNADSNFNFATAASFQKYGEDLKKYLN